ncbi:MAG: DNA-directed RNA polymerase subunit beta [Pseudoclavibacter sp.]|nr:DNA-directed RNA polymerase subunit beta [Pseudoclavibacter sp.]
MAQERFHKPVRLPGGAFDALLGGGDAAEASRVAHDTAAALLHRVRGGRDAAAVERLVSFADENGIDDIAELWAPAAAASLPGSLWRLYLVRQAAVRDPEGASYTFRRGLEVDRTISHVVAGPVTPTGPRELVQLVDEILRGAFTGDFALALDRAAAFARIMAQGAAQLAEGQADRERAAAETRRGVRYLQIAEELAACAGRWREDRLD